MDSTERVVYIYALRDPRDGRVRYVGRTVDPVGRLSHYRNPNKRQNGPVQAWVDELLMLELMPDMMILEIVPGSERDSAELRWIQAKRQECPDLLNRYDPRSMPLTSRQAGKRKPEVRDLLRPLSPGQWARDHDECFVCHTTEFHHQSHGLCSACYQSARSSAIRRLDPDPIAERSGKGFWSIKYDVCQECGKTEAPHAAHGLCFRCYQKARYHADPSKEQARRRNHYKRRAV